MAAPQADGSSEDALSAKPKRLSTRFSRANTGAGKEQGPSNTELLDVVLASMGQGQGVDKLAERVAARLQRVGMTFPGIEVRFKDLRAEVEVTKASSGIPTVTNTLFGAVRGLLASARGGECKRKRAILNDVSGVLKPGRMCLLLGPPGGGRTTLLRALAGQLQKDPGVRVTGGDVTYNGLKAGSDFVVERAATYVEQRDNHIAEMTVEETLAFAAECLGPTFLRMLYDEVKATEAAQGVVVEPELDKLWNAALINRSGKRSVLVELFARLMGIDHVLDTVVGDELLKGISGGQKRRVTSAEMVVGEASVMMMDEISNGLDSATTHNITKALREFARHTNFTIMITLLQPSPETFELFDDVMLLTHGRIVYLGPRDGILPFFAAQHLHCPPTITAADFLQEVTTLADQKKYWAPPDGSEWAWVTPVRLEETFKASQEGQVVAAALEQPPHKHPLQGLALHKEKYAQSTVGMVWVVMRREWLLLLRNWQFLIAVVFQAAFGGFMISTTFTQMSHDNVDDANLFLSVIFFSFMSQFMGGFNYVPLYDRRLPVFFRHRNHNFFAGWVYALSSVLLRVPEVLLNSSVYSLMVYFSVGMSLQAGRFFIFWLNLVAMGMISSSMFQFFGALFRNEVLAQGLGAVALMAFVNVSGFPISSDAIPPWWIWMYWICPMSWALRSMAINEMMSPEWNYPAGSDYGDISMGEHVLKLRGISTDHFWVWLGIGVIFATAALLTAAQAVVLTFIPPPNSKRGTEPLEGTPEADAELEEELLEAMAEQALAAEQEKLAAKGHLALAIPPPKLAGSELDLPSAGSPHAAASDASPDPLGASAHEHSDELPGRPAWGATVASPALPAVIRATGNGNAIANGNGHSNGTGNGLHKSASASSFKKVASMARLDSRVTTMKFEPVTLVFKDINYFVPKPKGEGELQLLNRVSGVFRPGVLSALMGASGAGKTTLMDVLAGRKTGGREEGVQLLNGRRKDLRTFARVAGYVEQFDTHTPQATVVESLTFSARMRLPADAQHPALITQYVKEAMTRVELTALANTMVGHPGSGLTMEQRKRLNIAVELVANPSLVFMDEPTTGLDARAAALVMKVARRIARAGRTVVCTIHQPSKDIFFAFDELLLLKPGGRTIFNGALGVNQHRLIDHFSALQGVAPMPELYNPANWMLEVTAPSAEKQLGIDFAEYWANSALAKEEEERIEQCAAKPTHGAASAAPSEAASVAGDGEAHGSGGAVSLDDVGYAVPTLTQLKLLVHRQFTSYYRMPEYNLLRYVVTIILGLMFGTLYWDVGTKRATLVDVLNIMGGLYSCTIFMGIFNCLVAMPVVISDRAVYYRERSSRMYSVMPYMLAQGAAEVPYIAVQSILYTIIVYFTIQFEMEATKFFWFLLFFFLNLLAFTHMGVAIAHITPSAQIATAFSGLFLNFWNVFCGFLIYASDIPGWWIWAYYWNPATWVLYGCITTQLGNVYSETIDVGNDTQTVAQYTEDTFNYKYSWRGWVALILIGHVAFFRGVAYFGLSRLNFSKR